MWREKESLGRAHAMMIISESAGPTYSTTCVYESNSEPTDTAENARFNFPQEREKEK